MGGKANFLHIGLKDCVKLWNAKLQAGHSSFRTTQEVHVAVSLTLNRQISPFLKCRKQPGKGK